jgi:hypothetical protein
VRPTQKLALAEAIARELARRYSYRDVDTYLEEFKIPTPEEYGNDGYKPTYVSSGQMRGGRSIVARVLSINPAKRRLHAPYEISGFVAHEDIHPTTEWQIEIERALNVMDAFLAIHTKGFSNSHWTQQEIGCAVARGVKIISFKMDEDPTGFISKHQALSRGRRSAEAIAKEVNTILLHDELTAARLKEVSIPF